MFLKPAGQPNTFDVFLGSGWDNWGQVRVNPDGTLIPCGGIAMDSFLLQRIKNRLSVMFYSDLRSKRKR